MGNPNSKISIVIEPQKLKFEEKRPQAIGADSSLLSIENSKKQLQLIVELHPGELTLGKKKQYKIGFFHRKKLAYNLNDEINSVELVLAQKADPTQIRKNLNKARHLIGITAKKYPYDPNVRALQAILKYADIIHVGVEDKLSLIQQTTLEIARAFFNGGLNAYNIKQFITVYNSYVHIWKEKAQRILNQVSADDSQISKLKKDIQRKLELIDQLSVDDDVMHRKLTVFREPLHFEIIQEAIDLITSELVPRKMTLANIRLRIIHQMLLAFHKIPLLSEISAEYSRLFPIETTPESPKRVLKLVLGMRLVASEQSQHELAMVLIAHKRGDKGSGELSSSIFQLFADYKETVEKYLMHLRTPYIGKATINPFLGMGQLLVDHGKIFSSYSEKGYKSSLKETSDILSNFVLKCPNKNSIIKAMKYRTKIQKVLADRGWLADQHGQAALLASICFRTFIPEEFFPGLPS